MPTCDNVGQNFAQAVVVSPITSSTSVISGYFQRVFDMVLRISRSGTSSLCLACSNLRRAAW